MRWENSNHMTVWPGPGCSATLPVRLSPRSALDRHSRPSLRPRPLRRDTAPGHTLLERIEQAILQVVPSRTMVTHLLDPLDGQRSWGDLVLARQATA